MRKMIAYIIEQLGEAIPFIVGISIFLICNIVLIVVNHFYNSTLKRFFFCKRHLWVTIFSLVLIVGFLILLLFVSIIENWIIYTVAGCCAGVIFLAWYFVLCPSPWTFIVLLWYRSKFKKGYLYEYADKLPLRLWCAVSLKDKFEYTVLRNQFLVYAGNFKASVECLNMLSTKRLLPKENDVILRGKMLAFKMVGANGTALELYNQISNHQPTDQCIYALIEEERGNISVSQEINRKLHDLQMDKKKKRYDQSVILNNYARSLHIQGNIVAAEDLLKQSIKYALDMKNYYGYVVSVQNLINVLLQDDTKKAIDCFHEYCQVLKKFPDSKWRFISFINPKLRIAEAINSEGDIKQAIWELHNKLGRLKLLDKINLLVTILNVMFRNKLFADGILKELYDISDDILHSPMPMRYRWAVDIVQKTASLNLPYAKELTEKLDSYLNSNGYEVNCEYLDSLPDYMIYEKCSIMKEKIFLKKTIEKQDFCGYLEGFRQVAELYKLNGLYCDYWHTLLQILKESTYYAESYADELNPIIEILDKELSEKSNNFLLADIYLGFAVYLYSIKEYDKARQYLKFFDNTKKPISSLSTYLRQDYEMLKSAVND